MRLVLLFVLLLVPCMAQETAPTEKALSTLGGYLIETAITPESYLITTADELGAFVMMLPKVTPYKTLPATPNPDRLLNGYSPDFEESVLVVATGLDRIADPPVFKGLETAEDGTRLVVFELPERRAKTFPYGWGVYTAVVLPRIEADTRVVMIKAEKVEDEGFKRADFKRADFKRL